MSFNSSPLGSLTLALIPLALIPLALVLVPLALVLVPLVMSGCGITATLWSLSDPPSGTVHTRIGAYAGIHCWSSEDS